MGTAAIIAGASAARALNDLLTAFRVADATAPTRAQTLATLGIAPSRVEARLERAGVIRPGADPDSRYLDERSLLAYQRQFQSRAVVWAAIAGVAVIALGAVAFLMVRRPPFPP